MVSAWKNFKIIFSRPLFINIFRPKILFFVTYSILTGDTKVEFVIYDLLSQLVIVESDMIMRQTMNKEMLLLLQKKIALIVGRLFQLFG